MADKGQIDGWNRDGLMVLRDINKDVPHKGPYAERTGIQIKCLG
jgi:hypothetical protein